MRTKKGFIMSCKPRVEKVVETASDAFEVRDLIKQHAPDLVTIDINMSKIDGVSFLRNLMRLHHGQPVEELSANIVLRNRHKPSVDILFRSVHNTVSANFFKF